jgi:hypothetical protein
MQLAARPPAPPMHRYLFAGTIPVWWEGTEGGEIYSKEESAKQGNGVGVETAWGEYRISSWGHLGWEEEQSCLC